MARQHLLPAVNLTSTIFMWASGTLGIQHAFYESDNPKGNAHTE